MIRDILKMGDERLLRIAPPVPEHMLGSAELQQLIDDMFETMAHVGGVGLAAPQVGIDLQMVIFGFERSERYPDAEPVPRTILLNPVITPLAMEVEDGWEGVCRCRACAAWCRATSTSAIRASTPGQADQPIRRRLSRTGGAARMRSLDRSPVSLADPGFQQVRLHRGAVPRA